MTLVDLKIRLPELLLMRMDKLVMQSSIEARVPFLDHELVEFVLSIPEEIIFKNNETKPLLKKVANKHISEKIFNRSKQGFRAPVGEWIKKDQNYFDDLMYFSPILLHRSKRNSFAGFLSPYCYKQRL